MSSSFLSALQEVFSFKVCITFDTFSSNLFQILIPVASQGVRLPEHSDREFEYRSVHGRVKTDACSL
jgi:hypothetical protein